MNYRPQRVSNLIRDELGKIILRELEFSGALVTLTEVKVDAHLENAKVMVSILPSGKIKSAMSQLVRRQGDLQFMLARKLNIKPMPRISFEPDPGPEKAAHIEKILLDQ